MQTRSAERNPILRRSQGPLETPSHLPLVGKQLVSLSLLCKQFTGEGNMMKVWGVCLFHQHMCDHRKVTKCLKQCLLLPRGDDAGRAARGEAQHPALTMGSAKKMHLFNLVKLWTAGSELVVRTRRRWITPPLRLVPGVSSQRVNLQDRIGLDQVGLLQ